MKAFIAFSLGVLSLPLYFGLGEGISVLAMGLGVGAYFFLCQFMLSRGRVDAYREDWPIMLALDAVPLMLVLLAVVAEKWPVILAQSFVILIPSCGGTFAGAVAASLVARSAVLRR